MKHMITIALILILTTPVFAGSKADSKSTSIAQQSQSQAQYQSQGQSQTQIFAPTQSQNFSPTNSVDYKPTTTNDITIEKTEPVIEGSFNSKTNVQRPLPYLDAPNVNTTGGPAAFWNPQRRPGPRFVSVEVLVKLLNHSPQNVPVDKDAEIHLSTQVLHKVTPYKGKVLFKIGTLDEEYTNPVAVFSVEADGDKTNSAALAVKLVELARSVGGTTVVFLSEGEQVQLLSKGYGLGFNQSAAYTGTSGGSIGGVSTGGTGFSKGYAYYVKFPWITAIIIR